jgi:hypothetical protein
MAVVPVWRFEPKGGSRDALLGSAGLGFAERPVSGSVSRPTYGGPGREAGADPARYLEPVFAQPGGNGRRAATAGLHPKQR